MKSRSLTLAEKRSLETGKELHLVKAERGYALAREITSAADDNTMVICLDLQQALPTPKVSTSIAFYKRKLWTYNFGIHDYKTKRGFMYLWDEITAKRGACEIASCIYKFITTQVPPTTKKLYIFSDNCPGQNKNYILILFYLHMVHKRHLEEITHIFFRVGHTYMPADSHFATIENAIRRQTFIYTPKNYRNIIKDSRIRNKFVVTEMEQADFYDFDQLKRRCTLRQPPKGVKFSNACYYRITKNYRIGYEFAPNYTQIRTGSGYQVRYTRGKGHRNDSLFNLNVPVPRKYLEPLALKPAKLKDLQDLVPGVVPNEEYNEYWHAILNSTPGQNNEDEDEPLDFCAEYD